ncbi:hypothetical protein HK096_006253, partial [Nowakowskiella sp. JEL0078]
MNGEDKTENLKIYVLDDSKVTNVYQEKYAYNSIAQYAETERNIIYESVEQNGDEGTKIHKQTEPKYQESYGNENESKFTEKDISLEDTDKVEKVFNGENQKQYRNVVSPNVEVYEKRNSKSDELNIDSIEKDIVHIESSEFKTEAKLITSPEKDVNLNFKDNISLTMIGFPSVMLLEQQVQNSEKLLLSTTSQEKVEMSANLFELTSENLNTDIAQNEKSKILNGSFVSLEKIEKEMKNLVESVGNTGKKSLEHGDENQKIFNFENSENDMQKNKLNFEIQDLTCSKDEIKTRSQSIIILDNNSYKTDKNIGNLLEVERNNKNNSLETKDALLK